MGITTKTKEAIKAAPLSAVIEATGGSLKRVGHEFVTECLWHDDNNPSLTVSDQKGFCFCHVCRASEDAIGYVQKKKGMSFPDAAEFSAAVLGIQVEYENVDPEKERQRRQARARTISKLKLEQDSYKEKLRDPRAERIRGILKARGLTAAASKEFGLGFSPLGPFSGRITIPIYNHRNELVGWTGRATQEDQKPKYKNSSESDLFVKKQLVFNEYRAMEAAREAGHVIFVEGHLDVVAMWQAGIKNVVAMQGTAAPDPSVLTRLARSAKTFVLCYDGDAGGRKAAEQFISVGGPMAMEGKININVAGLPEGQDPDEVIRSGGDLYSYIASAPSWLDWIIDSWVSHLDHNDGAMITEVESRLKKLINGLQSKALRTHYIDKASRVLSENSKEAEKLAKDWEQNRIEVNRLTWTPRDPSEIVNAAERRMLRLYVHCPELRPRLRPLFEKIQGPACRWLANRLTELEDSCSIDLTPHSVMAVVVVAEPQYLNQLRTLVRPNVIIDKSDGVIEHLCDIMGEAATPTPYEPHPDQ